VLPGNAAVQLLGRSATPENLKNVEEQLGLNKPIVEQYTTWIGNLAHGNLGTSLTQGRPVSDVVGDPVRNSAVLVMAALLSSILLSVPLGVIAAARRGRGFDFSLGLFSFTFTATPEFVVGTTLVIVFATTALHVLPAVSLIPPGESPFAHLNAFVLPAA